jgi:glucans biosynthesis protein C
MADRRNDIDWLRIIAVLLLFLFHSAHLFNRSEGLDWYVNNKDQSIFFDGFMVFLNQWHMPLFFLLSGIGTYYALQFRSGGEYVKERFKRIFVPFVFGTLVIVPPQVYVRNLLEGKFSGSYWAFYPHFFNGPHPPGNFEWGHLWFLIYLFTFSMIMRPAFQWLRGERGRAWVARLATLAERGGGYGIYLLALPVMFSETLLRPAFPEGNQNLIADWANFITYIILFSYGFLLFADPRFEQAIARTWKTTGWLALAFIIVFLSLLKFAGDANGYTPYSIAINFFRGLDTWWWLIWFLGLGRSVLTAGGRVLRYAAEAALPAYVLHQTAIVVLGYYVIQLDLNLYLKFVLLVLASFAATMLSYDLIIKRFNPIRVLFGMKWKKAEEVKA